MCYFLLNLDGSCSCLEIIDIHFRFDLLLYERFRQLQCSTLFFTPSYCLIFESQTKSSCHLCSHLDFWNYFCSSLQFCVRQRLWCCFLLPVFRNKFFILCGRLWICDKWLCGLLDIRRNHWNNKKYMFTISLNRGSVFASFGEYAIWGFNFVYYFELCITKKRLSLVWRLPFRIVLVQSFEWKKQEIHPGLLKIKINIVKIIQGHSCSPFLKNCCSLCCLCYRSCGCLPFN